MNSPVQNYEIILKAMQENCSNIESFKQVRTPGLSSLELTALSLTAEHMMYNSELQLFRVMQGTCPEGKTERSVYNRRQRKLFAYAEKIRQRLSEKFSHLSDVLIIDSAPVEICRRCRAGRSSICSIYEF